MTDPVARATATDPGTLETYRTQAQAWLAEADVPALPSAYEARLSVTKTWQRTLYDAGWIGIDWPQEFGGQGLTTQHRLIFSEELVRARAPYPAGTIGLEVVGPTVLAFGTDDQRRRYIPKLLRGDELWCQGFSEPDAGSDLANIRTSAVVDGDELVITGQKVWTSWATDTDWCAALVRTERGEPKHRGITYVAVDMRAPGLTVRPIVQITGDAEFNELIFEEVRVPIANVIGKIGDGWRLAMHTLGHERGGYAMRRRAENELAFIDFVSAVRADLAAGGDVDDQLVARLGRLYVELRAFEAQSHATAARLTAGDVPSPLDSVDKLAVSRTEQALYAAAVAFIDGDRRLSTGVSSRGLDTERWLKGLLYARAGSVYGGSRQIQRTIVAERLLGLPRSR